MTDVIATLLLASTLVIVVIFIGINLYESLPSQRGKHPPQNGCD